MMRYISKRAGVACITEMIREPRLWWFGHVMRNQLKSAMSQLEGLKIKRKTGIMMEGCSCKIFEEQGIEKMMQTTGENGEGASELANA